MSEVRTAIYEHLSADATLIGLLADGASGIHYEEAPGGADFPYIIFRMQDGLHIHSFDGNAIRPQVWLIKAVDEAQSATDAEAIDARISTLMHKASLSVADHSLLSCRRQSDVAYPERDGSELYRHVGGLYRLTIQHD